ncbi:hypothetical protein [Haloarchaeobius sp. DFWS5]|uniref:hypothetical protein n=1 Tax=Haloarchaeobius sp. DFWS5 TaxID=3446114 RepID=UPI003EBC2813
MPTVLDFEAERDRNSQSWQRADPDAALIEPLNRYGWRVLLPDGDQVHHVMLALEDGEYIGRCHTFVDGKLTVCDGHHYGQIRGDSTPECAHLCTIRKADFGDPTDDLHDQPITVQPVTDDTVRIDPDTHADRIRADGGVRR